MENWIDILSESAVTLAAHAWGKGKAETWGIISRHIDAGNFRQRMTLYQFQANVKLIADPQFFRHCPVCKKSHDISDISCSKCHVDLNIARQNAIEEEFKNFPIPQAPTPPPVLPKKQTVYTDEKWIAELKEARTVALPKIKEPSTQPKQKDGIEKISDWLSNQWQNSTAFRWIVILIIMYILGTFIDNDTSTISGPIYPGDQTYLESDEYRADQMEEYDLRANEDWRSDYYTPEPDEPYYFNEEETNTTSCLIKGNISFETGEKIYHLPGQKFYETTTIDPSYGERWFCTEAEAQAAGWRKARE